MSRRLISLLALFALGPTWAQEGAAPEPEKLSKLRGAWAEANERETRPIKDGYLNALIKLRDTLTTEGKLESAVLVRHEIEVLTQGAEPAESEKAEPAQLASLRATYDRERARILQGNERKYVAGLNSLLQAYSTEGGLEAALAVKTEIERVARASEEKGDDFSVKEVSELDKRKLYRSMLGVYGSHFEQESHPAVNLSVPNGDLWTPEIQDRLRGSIDFKNINFTGAAKLIVPAEAAYTFEIHNGALLLDEKEVSSGDLILKEGTHEVLFKSGTYGTNRMPTASIRIVKKGTEEELPLVNTGSDIQRFLKQRIRRKAVTEVSDWQPLEVVVK